MSPRVLILAAEYPHFEKDKDGIFIKDQAMALNRQGIGADVAFVEPRSIRSLSVVALRESHFQTETEEEDGVLTLRAKGWNPWMNSVAGGVVYAHLTCRLGSRYIKLYGRPDLIHAHNTFWAGYAASLLAKKFDLPYIITEHSSRFVLKSITPAMRLYATATLASASVAVGVSRAVATALREYGAKDATVIPNVVDTDFFCLPLQPRRQGPFTFVCIGNMNYNKGFHVLLRAFARLRTHVGSIRLVLGGDGPQRGEFEKLSRELGLCGVVTFSGSMGRNEVREALWEGDALVLPSFRETFGVVLIEALATGIPVIAGRSGGPQDVVNSGCGLLFEPGNEEELAMAMAKLMTMSFDSATLRGYAVENFSRNALLRRLSALYQEITERKER